MTKTKQELRATIRARLRALDAVDRERKSTAAVAQFLNSDVYAGAKTVLAYDAFGTEVLTAEVIRRCIEDGKTLALPRTEPRTFALNAHRVTDVSAQLERHAMGFREPLASLPRVPPEQIDLVLVPGLAFDEHGRRLGRGAGYYDRFLARPELRATLVSLAFECQIVLEVPALDHDRAVSVIFTEARRIDCRR